MHCTRNITDAITWVGGNDRRLALFENLFPIPRGVSYNSYLIMDEKTALIDTADAAITRQFIENVTHTLAGRSLDYLVVNHMEPDHCANIDELMLRYPDLKIVGNAKTFGLIQQFYGMDLQGRTIAVKENDALPLGKHTLRFYFAPMVHWPEVMVTYEESEKILFSADAFGSFGAINGNLFDDEIDFDRDWIADARRYYTNIVGKYGPQVQAALKKLSGLEIRTICPLHGPIWRSDLGYLLNKYDRWSRYEPEERTVAIFYCSMYGDTENAADILAAQLAEAGIKNIGVYDVSSTHVSTLIAEAFRCSHLVLAAPTYNNGIYPAMMNLLHDMKALNLQNRTIGLIENGSWAPSCAKNMRALLDEMKNMQVLEPVVTLKSSLNDASQESLMQLKDAILSSLASKE
ncbi:MAG TPA: FprA family A-type flavoprotein [Candidatus Gallacutalibacter stercoravium]|nr:FprA family A-type flavoprotein [Candidatus Gallacutalibacter stercoravium]